jgi:hypothetical protein
MQYLILLAYVLAYVIPIAAAVIIVIYAAFSAREWFAQPDLDRDQSPAARARAKREARAKR